MRIFLRKSNRQKSSKPIRVIRIFLASLMTILFIMGIIRQFDFYYFGLVFLAGSVISLIDGFESLFRKEKREVYVISFGEGILYIGLSIFLMIIPK